MKKWGLIYLLYILIILNGFLIVLINDVSAMNVTYNVTITPPNYQWRYLGNNMSLSFKVCHDAKKTVSIPVLALVETANMNNLKNVNFHLINTNVTTSTCGYAYINISYIGGMGGLAPQDVILTLKTYDPDPIPVNENCHDYYWVDNNTNKTNNNISNCNKTKQFCGLYLYYGLVTFNSSSDCIKYINTTNTLNIGNMSNSTYINQTAIDAQNAKKKNRQLFIILLVVAAAIGIIYYIYYTQTQEEAQ